MEKPKKHCAEPGNLPIMVANSKLVCSFACLFVHSLVNYFVCLLIHLLHCLFLHSLDRTLVCLFIRLSVLFFFSLVNSLGLFLCLFVPSFVCSFIRLCVYFKTSQHHHVTSKFFISAQVSTSKSKDNQLIFCS